MTATATARRRGSTAPLPKPPRVPLPRQLAATYLYAFVARAPSRQGLPKGSYPRADLRENLQLLYDALWRHAHATRTAALATTWEQVAVGMGYDLDVTVVNAQLDRWMGLLREVGLVDFGPDCDATGATRRLRVQLLEPSPAWIAEIEAELDKRVTGLEPVAYSLEGCRSTN